MDGGTSGYSIIAGSRILAPVEISTVDSSVAFPSIATIGTIVSGLAINVGTIQVGTINTVVDVATINSVGTVGTILSGLPVVGTIGTIISGQITATESPASPVFATVSGTIIGGAGTLYGVIADSVAGTGTLMLYQAGSLMSSQTVAANQNFVWMIDRGVAVSTLVASLVGTLTATFFR